LRFSDVILELTLEITDVLLLGRIEEKVADGSNEGVNTEGEVHEDEVRPSSGSVTFGLEGSVVDDKATDPTEEESQKETDQLVVIDRIVVHETDLLSERYMSIFYHAFSHKSIAAIKYVCKQGRKKT
jgi:hypothetical protein